MSIERSDWVRRFGAAVGVEPPSAQEIAHLLELADLAADSSDPSRGLATAWLAGRTDLSPAEAAALGSRLAQTIDHEQLDELADELTEDIVVNIQDD